MHDHHELFHREAPQSACSTASHVKKTSLRFMQG
jgi:hypothetical protein